MREKKFKITSISHLKLKMKENILNTGGELIFIPINKTGTTSIDSMICSYYNTDHSKLHFPHISARWVKRNFPDDFDKANVVCSVRNTFDRLRSIYKYSKISIDYKLKYSNFKDFIMDDPKNRPYPFFPGWEREVAGNYYYQDTWVTNQDGELIVDNIANIFDDPEDIFLSKFNFHKEIDIPIKNSTSTEEILNYTEDMIQKVYSEFKKEIDLFGFKYNDNK